MKFVIHDESGEWTGDGDCESPEFLPNLLEALVPGRYTVNYPDNDLLPDENYLVGRGRVEKI